METFKVVLSFESVDEILWCDHSNEPLSAVLSWYCFNFYLSISKNEIWDLS